jgi:hypothetical protein
MSSIDKGKGKPRDTAQEVPTLDMTKIQAGDKHSTPRTSDFLHKEAYDHLGQNPSQEVMNDALASEAHYRSLPKGSMNSLHSMIGDGLRRDLPSTSALSAAREELSSIRQDLQAFKDGMVKRELRLASPTPDSGNVYTFTLKRYEGPASETESKSKKYEGEASEVNRINGLRPQALAKTTLHRGDINRYLQNVKTGEGRHSIRGFKVVGDTGDIRDRVEE